MSRFVPSLALILALVLAPLAANAGIVSVSQAMQEQYYGQDNAPLTVYEYYSLSCPHCRHFFETTFPEVKKNYIDTGKVKFVLRDFPLNGPALGAAMIARCSGPRYKGMVDLFFKSQMQWAYSQDPLQELTRVARFGGMSSADVEACLKQQAIQDGVNEEEKQAEKKYGINATPSFVIEGKVYTGAMEYDQFKQILDEHLKNKKAAN